jgi:hypothetical protein
LAGGITDDFDIKLLSAFSSKYNDGNAPQRPKIKPKIPLSGWNFTSKLRSGNSAGAGAGAGAGDGKIGGKEQKNANGKKKKKGKGGGSLLSTLSDEEFERRLASMF